MELERRHPVPDQKRERGDDQRVPRQPEDVGDAGQRRVRHVVEANAPDRVADGPARQRTRDEKPRDPALGGPQRSREAARGRCPQQPVVDPLLEEGVRARSAQAEVLVGGVQQDRDAEQRPDQPDPRPAQPARVLSAGHVHRR